MKTFVRLYILNAVLILASTVSAQTYTTIANGAWNNAATWQGGVVPPVNGSISSGVAINIKHIVTYSGSNINNQGTINISNSGGPAPRLIVPTGITFTNKSGGKLVITNGEYRQYRFAGGGESGTPQTGAFNNNGGSVSALNSYIEVALTYNNSGGQETFNNCVLNCGQGFTVTGGNALDTLAFTSVSVGMQGSGDFSIQNGSIYFKTLRVEVASSAGQFSLSNGTVNGSIDFITLKNHVTNTYSSNNISAASGINTSGLTLNSYCIGGSSTYNPNGKITGSQTPSCSSTYFPAAIIYNSGTSRLNFSVDPTLTSGTAKQVGAKYKYEGAAPGMDVIVTIDSVVNGAVINTVDDNTGANGGYIEAFQPIITSGPAVGSSYAVFRFNYNVTETSVPVNMDTASITALDIDGGNGIHEFDQISLGAGAAGSYWGANPLISLSQVSGAFRGIDIAGLDKPGVDTTSKANMFTTTNKLVSTFTAKLGMVTTSAQTTQRLFSLYAKSFNYPNPTPLPVTLTDFTAQYAKPNIALAWNSAQEIDFNYYELEHSSDGKNFSTTAIVFGAGENGQGAEYTYTDKSVAGKSGLIYYRLKMVDIDGKFTYSPVRIIRLGEDNNSLTLMAYPNPVSNELRITLPTAWQGKQVNISLYNTSGQRVNALTIENSSQTETIQVTSLQRGAYFLKANCGQDVVSQQIIKN